MLVSIRVYKRAGAAAWLSARVCVCAFVCGGIKSAKSGAESFLVCITITNKLRCEQHTDDLVTYTFINGLMSRPHLSIPNRQYSAFSRTRRFSSKLYLLLQIRVTELVFYYIREKSSCNFPGKVSSNVTCSTKWRIFFSRDV